MSIMKHKCDNCGALVESIGTTTDGRKICCVECAFNPLGCRCKFGEYGVAETENWASLSGYDDDDDVDEDHYEQTCTGCGGVIADDYSTCICEVDDEIEFTACDNCDGHPACEDFGCAIALGIKIKPPFLDSSSL